MKEKLTNGELLATFGKIAETLDRVDRGKKDRGALRESLLIIQELATAALADEYCFFE